MRDEEYWIDAAPAAGLKAQSFRGIWITAAVQIPKVSLMLASQLILARLLLPGDFGLVAMATPVIGFVQVVADLGLTQAVVSRPRLALSQLNAFFWINLGLSVLLGIVAALLGPVMTWLFGEPRVGGIVVACAALIVVSGVGTLQGALLNRQLRFGIIGLVEVVSLLAMVVVSTVSAWMGWGYWSLVFAQAATTVTTTALYWVFSSWRPRLPSIDPSAWSLVRFGSNITVSNLAGYLNMTLDNVMVGAVLGRVTLGLYDRAWKLAVQPLSQIQAPFNRVAIPALSRVAHAPERYRSAFLQMAQAMLVVVTPATLFAAIYARPLIAFLLGDRWLPAAPIFAWLGFGAAIIPVNSAIFWLFVSQGRGREQMIFGTVTAVINIVAYAIGLPFGIIGVVQMSIASLYFVQTPLLMWAATRTGPVGASALAALAPNVAASGVGVAILWQLRPWLAQPQALPMLLAALTSFGTYLAVLLCWPTTRSLLLALLALPATLRADAAARRSAAMPSVRVAGGGAD